MKQIILIAIIAGIAAVLPLVTGESPYFTGVMISVLMMAALSSAWNILGGYAGQYSFGHAAYFGAGAYTTMILITQFNLNPLLSMAAGIIIACLIALVLGAGVWAIGAHFQNSSQSMAGRRAVVTAIGAAILIGAAPQLINFFFSTGLSVK